MVCGTDKKEEIKLQRKNNPEKKVRIIQAKIAIFSQETNQK